MCHPMPGASGFDPNPLITRDANVRVLSFERPGYGSSDPLGEADSAQIQARADDIAEYLVSDRTQIEQLRGLEFGAVGWGLGGAVALSLAARHPALIARVASVGLAVRAVQSAQDEPLPQIVGGPPEAGPHTFARDALGIDSNDPAFDIAGLGLRLDHMLAQAAVQRMIGIETDSAAAKDLSWADELDKVTASTVLIYGHGDGGTSSASGGWLRDRIKNARVVGVPDAGGLAIASVWRRILDEVTAPEAR
jgi:pimeloyl-ACP methyl ester carboxylesterase